MKYIKQSLRSNPDINDIKFRIFKLEARIRTETRAYMDYKFNHEYPWKLDHTKLYEYVAGQLIFIHKKLIRLRTVLAVLEGKICI